MEIYSSEEQQVEAIKRFWHEYGKAILGGVVLGLAALYGFRFYQAEQRGAAEAASVKFSQLVEQRDAAAPSDDWLAQAQGFIAASNGDNYTVLAALLAAKDAIALQQYDKAAEQLNWVLSHSKQPELLAVTQLRLARVQREQGNLDAALSTLAKPMPESFAAIQAELKGDILLQSDKPADAKAAYQQALDSAGQNKQLLQIKLDELAHVTAV
ncbi:YfgM family protein [Rheinheimera pleomorphica]|uniref:YfgM family protein n=1 Tax=Rheinheimera pleomorphica TaxID=2703963 RepID=UPI0014204D21|nr:tetratricopeptide repeat protein [Rheinheimera pleomorphica]